VVVIVIGGGVDAQSVIQELGLEADLIRGQFLGPKLQRAQISDGDRNRGAVNPPPFTPRL